jgi:excisionase family DNA binding protein
MEDHLLTIGEAARLVGVSESTLREWDANDKFPSARTAGGHRRYKLEQVREYLEKNLPKAEQGLGRVLPEEIVIQLNTDAVPNSKKAVERMDKAGQLDRVSDSYLRSCLAVLLENYSQFHETNICPEGWSKSFGMGLTRKAFKACRFWQMVSVQPMLGPASLVYFMRKKDGNLLVETEAVAAKTHKYHFSVFDSNPEDMVDTYAQAVARELEFEIVKHLPRIEVESFEKMPDKGAALRAELDYLVGPKSLIEELRGQGWGEEIDLYDMVTVLDEETFKPVVAGGKYVSSYLEAPPVFAPYILTFPGPRLFNGTCSVMCRAGWYEKKK